MQKDISTSINLDFASFQLYENYVISTINEGIVFDFPHLKEVTRIFKAHYATTPFVSIANRKYDYTINPTCLMESKIIDTIIGIGVVCYSESAFEMAQFEKKFYKGELQVFRNLEHCLSWTKEKLNEYNKKAGL